MWPTVLNQSLSNRCLLFIVLLFVSVSLFGGVSVCHAAVHRWINNDDSSVGLGPMRLPTAGLNRYVESYEDELPVKSKLVCLLGTVDDYVARWSYPNGTLKLRLLKDGTLSARRILDLSHNERKESDILAMIKQKFPANDDEAPTLLAMSVAFAELKIVPLSALEAVNASLELLSLRGNNFHRFLYVDSRNYWDTFPMMPQLQELDLTECRITMISDSSFDEMPRLQRLYLAGNRIQTMSSQSFVALRNLFHLDLSFNFVDRRSGDVSDKDREDHEAGLALPLDIFHSMNSLQFLDLSHTKIRLSNMNAFVRPPVNLQMLSLCYTFTILPPLIFAKTRLRVLDLSGNTAMYANFRADSMTGLAETLEVLAMYDANVRTLNFYCTLKSLRILLVSCNSISVLQSGSLNGLDALEWLDLSDNHLENWYSTVLHWTPNLRLLRLNDNNINLVTVAMFRDFRQLQYLALGNNNFICTCSLRDFMDVAAMAAGPIVMPPLKQPSPPPKRIANLMRENSSGNRSAPLTLMPRRLYNVTGRLYSENRLAVAESESNLKLLKSTILEWNLMMVPNSNWTRYKGTKRKRFVPKFAKTINNEVMNFTFKLIDYHETRYRCINSTSSEIYQLNDIKNCSTSDRDLEGDSLPLIEATAKYIVAAVLGSVFGLMLLYVVLYYNWWYIRYVWMTLRNGAILSSLKREHRKRLVDEGGGNEVGNSKHMYDVFVSYCDQNRDWILKEFLPNVDQCPDIKVCLHERDFQVYLK